MCDLHRELVRRNEELQAENAQLKSELYGLGYESPAELRLTDAQDRMLRVLVQHDRVAPVWLLFDASRTRRSYAEHGESNLVNVTISHMRAKLKPFGLVIETVWGRGYRLSPESRERLNKWNTPTQERAA